jgi:hypothetical protein
MFQLCLQPPQQQRLLTGPDSELQQTLNQVYSRHVSRAISGQRRNI